VEPVRQEDKKDYRRKEVIQVCDCPWTMENKCLFFVRAEKSRCLWNVNEECLNED
jgi:hypothetical protein